ncbi:hypothetical protein Moror_6919 [Moniliophthora roreri MCA 2997]|uniref:Uncharacterized protein n=1 Tax=Moniliophthora roreri (strain MCA 2997) TaxID=1381753 RepID=V2XU84_MONRO|nr:hypothetical protein Moror_6919 [Moniliophthora roreri MCA 2997]
MSGAPSGSGSGNPQNSPKPKAISSLAKRPTDVTRSGTQKLKFVPTLPARRKKEEVKPEPQPEAVQPPPTQGRGRGNDAGEGRGRGRGVPRPQQEMTASGPFAMGPTMASGSARRSVPASNFTPIPIPSKGRHTSLGAGLTHTATPSIKVEEGKSKGKAVEEDEVYSDPDDGVEILDMENVQKVDYMAPDVLKEVKHIPKVKKEDSEAPDQAGGVNLSNAIDLSESEEEEEMEDIIDDFGQQVDISDDPTLRQDRLYFFQFPSPFPSFELKNMDVDMALEASVSSGAKRVSFAADVKQESSQVLSQTPPQPSTEQKTQPLPALDGVIGKLEVYRSGAVKMRLANGILLDVTAGTQPSFLQHAVSVDMVQNKMTVLGEINKHFTVAPNVDTLLAAMEASETATDSMEGDGLIRMDES